MMLVSGGMEVTIDPFAVCRDYFQLRELEPLQLVRLKRGSAPAGRRNLWHHLHLIGCRRASLDRYPEIASHRFAFVMSQPRFIELMSGQVIADHWPEDVPILWS